LIAVGIAFQAKNELDHPLKLLKLK